MVDLSGQLRCWITHNYTHIHTMVQNNVLFFIFGTLCSCGPLWRGFFFLGKPRKKRLASLARLMIMQDFFRFETGPFRQRQKNIFLSDSKRSSFITDFFELQFDTATLIIPSFRMIKARGCKQRFKSDLLYTGRVYNMQYYYTAVVWHVPQEQYSWHRHENDNSSTAHQLSSVSYTHLTLPTICSV